MDDRSRAAIESASQAKWLADTVEFRDFHRWHSYPVNINLCNLDEKYVYKVPARSYEIVVH